jgi:capsular polysaccharide biosynthesis protein
MIRQPASVAPAAAMPATATPPAATPPAIVDPETLERVRQAWRDAPEDDRAAARYGSLLALAGRFPESLAVCDRALALDPSAAATLSNRGATLLRLERPAEALRAYDAALRLNPGLAQAAQGRDRTMQALVRAADALMAETTDLFARHRWAETEERAARALALCPGHVEAFSTLLLVLRLQGRHDERHAMLRAMAAAHAPAGATAAAPQPTPLSEQAFATAAEPVSLAACGDAVVFVSNRAVIDPLRPDTPIRPGVYSLTNVAALPTDWSFLTADGRHVYEDMVVVSSALSARFTDLCPHVRALPDGRRQVAFDRCHRYGEPVFFVGGSAANYYHWLLDYLPRIVLYREYGFAESGLRLALVRDPPAYVREALTLLGLDDRHMLWIEPEMVASFPRLLVASQFSRRGNVHPSAAGFLRGALPPPAGRAPWRRLYVSRADAGKRRVVNEDALTQALAAQGFERIVCSEYGFSEQRQLFAEASIIVAPHGASLANLIWCAPRAVTLIELMPDAEQLQHFAMLSRMIDARYEVVRSGPDLTERPGDQGSDFTVDVAAVLDRLHRLPETPRTSP